jgi:outer membrane biosynthesis protein TonB
MSAFRWTAVPVVAIGVLAGNVGFAAADELPAAATPTPAPAADPTPTLTPTPVPGLDPTPTPIPTPIPSVVTGTVIYVTTITTTTTIVSAPITVIAAPITTTINTTTSNASNSTSSNSSTDSASSNSASSNTSAGTNREPAAERFVINLKGCGAAGGGSPTAARTRVRRAKLHLARNASLVVRVNGRRVTTLHLPSTTQRHPRGVALRLRLSASGMLTIRRPSGSVLAVQGCVPA